MIINIREFNKIIEIDFYFLLLQFEMIILLLTYLYLFIIDAIK